MSMFSPKVDAEHAYTPDDGLLSERPADLPYAIFAGGCFWCIESEFRRLDGVKYTISGYTGGSEDTATYDQISTGKTKHAEATQIYFDPNEVSYEKLVRYFLTIAHDPTQLNGQGVDLGPQYRSALFYVDDAQKKIAEQVIDEITEQGYWKKPIVTEILPEQDFYAAEEYHQQYYEKYEEKTGRPHIRVLYKLQK